MTQISLSLLTTRMKKMTNNKIPERINVHIINNGETFPDNVRITEAAPGILLPDDIDEYEYVRADLVPALTGSSSEEWAEGEFRWVKIESEDNPWELAKAYYDPFISPDMQVSVDDSLFDMSKVVVFGPVIRKPSY